MTDAEHAEFNFVQGQIHAVKNHVLGPLRARLAELRAACDHTNPDGSDALYAWSITDGKVSDLRCKYCGLVKPIQD